MGGLAGIVCGPAVARTWLGKVGIADVPLMWTLRIRHRSAKVHMMVLVGGCFRMLVRGFPVWWLNVPVLGGVTSTGRTVLIMFKESLYM